MQSSRLRARSVVVAMAAALLLSPSLAAAALERVGPSVPSHGFPAWYQDGTGVTLEFCTPLDDAELAGGHCLLLPGDTLVPEVFPTAFADEHFYWAGEVVGDWSYEGQTGGVRLVLGLEAAFAVGSVIAGDQIVFGRIRIRIDDLPLSGTYTVYTPYGRYVFPDQVAGERLFYTEDIGLNCTLGDFTCALQSNLGPFLLASTEPGGAELAPVPGPVEGKLYIADPGRSGPVTGSPITEDYETSEGPRNPNLFRVEGPGGIRLFESFDFTLVGRLFQGAIPADITVDRATYARDATTTRVDVFATAYPNVEPRLPAQPVVPPTAPILSFFAAPCAEQDAPGGGVLLSAPVGTATAMVSTGEVYWAQSQPPALPTGVCVAHDNAVSGGRLTPVYFDAPLRDQVSIAQATFDPESETLLVEATSSDGVTLPVLTVGAFGAVPSTDLDESGRAIVATPAPPAKVRVRSAEGGANEMQVTVLSAADLNGAPAAVPDAAETVANTPVVVDVLANDSDPDGDTIVLSSVTQAVNGSVSITGGTVTYTPAFAFSGSDAFTYTIADGRGGFGTAAVSVTVLAGGNLPPTANSDAASTGPTQFVDVQVLANDTDPNGDPLSVASLTQPLLGTVTTDGVVVRYTPPAGSTGGFVETFEYVVSDGRGGSASGTVTVTVRSVETLTVTLAQFRNPSEWRVSGASTVEGATVTIHAGSDLTGAVIGTAQVANGVWTFRARNSAVPVNTRISVVSTGGAERLDVVVTIR